MQTFTLAWQTPLLGWILLVEIATLSYLWGSSAWLPAWLRDEHHFSLHATGFLAAIPFLLSLGSKFLGGVLLDKMRPDQAPVLFVVGGILTASSVVMLMLSHQPGWLALFMLSANIFWGLQGRPFRRLSSIMRRGKPLAVPTGSSTGLGIFARRLFRC